MNAAAVNQWEETITEPLYVRIEGTEGQITQLAITQDGMAGQISDAEGNITALQPRPRGWTPGSPAPRERSRLFR